MCLHRDGAVNSQEVQSAYESRQHESRVEGRNRQRTVSVHDPQQAGHGPLITSVVGRLPSDPNHHRVGDDLASANEDGT